MAKETPPLVIICRWANGPKPQARSCNFPVSAVRQCYFRALLTPGMRRHPLSSPLLVARSPQQDHS